MVVQPDAIIGRQVVRVLAAPINPIYDDHLVELDSGAVIKFSWGKLENVDLSTYAAIKDEKPTWALCASRRDDPVPNCCGRKIVGVLFSQGLDADGQRRRNDIYLLLDDGRYLTSGLGMNYTELEADFFFFFHPDNKRPNLLFEFWTDRPVNPFGRNAMSTE